MSSVCCRVVRGLLLVAVVFAAGCTSGLPPTYPVTGSVVYKGGQPMKGGTIQFLPLKDEPLLRVVGEIGQDGSFSLTTVKDNAKASGAPEGEYRVQVTPPLQRDPRGGLPEAHRGTLPIDLPKTYKVEARQTTLKIELPRPPS